MAEIRQNLYRKRCVRLDLPGHAHELTFSCYKSMPLLSNENFCLYLVEAIVLARKKHTFDLWAYVFMPEHVHLLLYPRGNCYSMSKIFQTIKQSAGRKAIIYIKNHDPISLEKMSTRQRHSPYRFWQDGGGYDRNIVAAETLTKMVNYIHANPVRRGLVASPIDWKWSSALDWSSCGRGPIAIDRESFPI
jgi:putative transposase